MKAKDSNPDRTRLLADGLSHKVRNLLGALRSHLALIQKFTSPATPQTDGRLKEQIQKSEQLVQDMDEVLREFLAYANPAEDVYEDVDPSLVLHDALARSASDLEGDRIRVIKRVDPELPGLRVDRGKLTQAMVRLIHNARQAMPGGGALLLRARKLPRGLVHIDVGDTGCGIPDKDQARIFQPFFSTKPGSLGLSLAIVQRDVEAWGGRIRFVSRPGKATIFRITLQTAERLKGGLARRQRQRLQPVS